MKISGFLIVLIVIILSLASCDLFHPKIKITRDYVYNSWWGKENTASIVLWRLLPNNELTNMDIKDLDAYFIAENSVRDTLNFILQFLIKRV